MCINNSNLTLIYTWNYINLCAGKGWRLGVAVPNLNTIQHVNEPNNRRTATTADQTQVAYVVAIVYVYADIDNM